MYDPCIIANYFIKLYNEDNNKKCVLNHHLIQKLIYISNGYYLALTDKLLINENYIPFHDFGVICLSLYNELHNTNNQELINKIENYDENIISEDIKLLLHDIYHGFKTWDIEKIINFTRNKPYKKAIKNEYIYIDDEDIKKFFKKYIKS